MWRHSYIFPVLLLIVLIVHSSSLYFHGDGHWSVYQPKFPPLGRSDRSDWRVRNRQRACLDQSVLFYLFEQDSRHRHKSLLPWGKVSIFTTDRDHRRICRFEINSIKWSIRFWATGLQTLEKKMSRIWDAKSHLKFKAFSVSKHIYFFLNSLPHPA